MPSGQGFMPRLFTGQANVYKVKLSTTGKVFEPSREDLQSPYRGTVYPSLVVLSLGGIPPGTGLTYATWGEVPLVEEFQLAPISK